MNELIAQNLIDTVQIIAKGLVVGLIVVVALVAISAILRARR